jgi:tetratricopeptide (TPR) repeat protein
MSVLSMPAGGVSLRVVVMGGFLAFGLQSFGWTAEQDPARAVMETRDSSAPARPDWQASASLASANRRLGDYRSAERVLRRAMETASGGAVGRVTLIVNLADLLREEARWSEADQILNSAAALPDLPRESRISILLERAELRREMREWPESIADWNEIGRIAEQEHSESLEEIYTGGLGETWLASGETARAEPLLRRSLALLRKDPAASSAQIATALALTAQMYTAEDKLALAREALDEAISRDETSLGREHPQMAVMLELHATSLSRRGETDAARADLDRARSIMTTHFGAESTAVAGVDATLGYVEDRARQPELAAAAYGRALTLLHKTNSDGMKVSEQLAKCYAAALKAAHRGHAPQSGLALAGVR